MLVKLHCKSPNVKDGRWYINLYINICMPDVYTDLYTYIYVQDSVHLSIQAGALSLVCSSRMDAMSAYLGMNREK